MKKLTVTIPEIPDNSYPIFIGENLLEKINDLIDLKKYSKVVIITDKNIEKFWLGNLKTSIAVDTYSIIVQPGEKEKNIQTLQYIWSEMIKAKVDRKSLIINLGGGVIGDIGGFAASTYMRGIDFVQITTSITAAVDAMVGGKTGINFGNIKNIIGTFSQPKAVVIDIDLLKTLRKREFTAGFTEIIKHGLIASKNYFNKVTAKNPKEFSATELEDIIYGSCQIKAKIVIVDEKEHSIRKLLNLGHTIGHTLEILSQQTPQPLLHGEAVSIGIAAENEIAVALGILPRETADFVRGKILALGLPVTYKGLQTEDILKIMRLDKKNEHGKINFTLLKQIGEAVINQEVEEKIILEVVNKL